MEVAKLNSSSTESPNAVGVGVQDPVESKVRHVYVLARPLKVAGVFSFLSHGKFPLCHWGVLLSELEYLEKRANVFLEFFGEVRTSPGFLTEHTHKVWGSLFDLYRDPITHKNKPHVVYNFGHSELHREWRVLALRKVGTTMFQDGQIYEKAHSITSTYPHYDGYSNNCQNFVRYLLEDLCPGLPAPKTIQDLIDGLFHLSPPYPDFASFFSSQAPMSVVTEIPGAYPPSPTWAFPRNLFPFSVASSCTDTTTWYSAKSTYVKRSALLTTRLSTQSNSWPEEGARTSNTKLSVTADMRLMSLFPTTRNEIISEYGNSLPVRATETLGQHTQGDSEQQTEDPLQVIKRDPLQVLKRALEKFEAQEAAELWVSEMLPSVSLSAGIEYLDAALTLVSSIVEEQGAKQVLSRVKQERIQLRYLLGNVERDIHRLLHEWAQGEMESVGFSKTDFAEITSALTALLSSLADRPNPFVIEDLSNRLDQTESKNNFLKLLLRAINLNYPNYHELLGTIVLRTVEQRRDPGFTMEVLKWVVGENSNTRHLDWLLEPLVAEAVSAAELSAISGLVEGLPPTLPWLPDMLIRLVERMRRDGNLLMGYSLLRKYFSGTCFANGIDWSTGTGKYFLDLAMEFGRHGDDGSLDELEWIIMRAGRPLAIDIAFRWRNEIVKYNACYAPRLLLCLEKVLRDRTSSFTEPAYTNPKLITLIDELLDLEQCKDIGEMRFWKYFSFLRTITTAAQ